MVAARTAGTEDSDIHDTALIAAFCMYSHYVSCLVPDLPTRDDYYGRAGDRVVTDGCATASEQKATRADNALVG